MKGTRVRHVHHGCNDCTARRDAIAHSCGQVTTWRVVRPGYIPKATGDSNAMSTQRQLEFPMNDTRSLMGLCIPKQLKSRHAVNSSRQLRSCSCGVQTVLNYGC
ncbi:hypothetical protein J6590_054389 [Homalodisca vitripennis]|nr:hypothetical protein J6590_054389 [Homalodisca vitripennis]